MGRTRAAQRRRSWALLGALAVGIALVGGSSGVALAHKDKLPPDALSLVRQAAALLAQDPKMSGEAKERLEAALTSRDPRGIVLAKVTQALNALAARDIPGARRALAEATAMPEAGSPAAPTQPGTSPQTASPPAPRPSPVPGVAPEQRPSVPDAMARMKMAEPLAVWYGGTPGELTALVAGLAFVVVGFVTLFRRG